MRRLLQLYCKKLNFSVVAEMFSLEEYYEIKDFHCSTDFDKLTRDIEEKIEKLNFEIISKNDNIQSGLVNSFNVQFQGKELKIGYYDFSKYFKNEKSQQLAFYNAKVDYPFERIKNLLYDRSGFEFFLNNTYVRYYGIEKYVEIVSETVLEGEYESISFSKVILSAALTACINIKCEIPFFVWSKEGCMGFCQNFYTRTYFEPLFIAKSLDSSSMEYVESLASKLFHGFSLCSVRLPSQVTELNTVFFTDCWLENCMFDLNCRIVKELTFPYLKINEQSYRFTVEMIFTWNGSNRSLSVCQYQCIHGLSASCALRDCRFLYLILKCSSSPEKPIYALHSPSHMPDGPVFLNASVEMNNELVNSHYDVLDEIIKYEIAFVFKENDNYIDLPREFSSVPGFKEVQEIISNSKGLAGRLSLAIFCLLSIDEKLVTVFWKEFVCHLFNHVRNINVLHNCDSEVYVSQKDNLWPLQYKFEMLNFCLQNMRAERELQLKSSSEFFNCYENAEEVQRNLHPEGRLKPHDTNMLIKHPEEHVYEPILRSSRLADFIFECELHTQMGDHHTFANQEERLQNDLNKLQRNFLLSDMQAFKAANLNCCFEDFVRWCSPKDIEFNGKEWKLSERMSNKEGWYLVWTNAVPLPISQQGNILDFNKTAKKILNYFVEVTWNELYELILPYGLMVALRALLHTISDNGEVHFRDYMPEIFQQFKSCFKNKKLPEYLELLRLMEKLYEHCAAFNSIFENLKFCIKQEEHLLPNLKRIVAEMVSIGYAKIDDAALYGFIEKFFQFSSTKNRMQSNNQQYILHGFAKNDTSSRLCPQRIYLDVENDSMNAYISYNVDCASSQYTTSHQRHSLHTLTSSANLQSTGTPVDTATKEEGRGVRKPYADQDRTSVLRDSEGNVQIDRGLARDPAKPLWLAVPAAQGPYLPVLVEEF
ncbi:Rab3 GTPase-activating protein catalytic subunit [Trichinella nelsoni]|uniref:Rab3 GTPase-activating protein catalytic subunit n=1 Tax=Trichinella nelsoni TaxID=6336 RepID=A0A0V0RZW2_9BILA|nr:Rab3 GTPase-activating protein catalytic subunit [Trichinella nelsoni]